MIRVFLLLLASVAGTWFLADSIKQKGPGYVYVYFNQYSLETSFWFGLLLLTAVVIALFVLVKLFSLFSYYLIKIGYLPRFFGMSRAKKLRYQGMLAYINQQWFISGKKLAKAGKYSEFPFLDYLMAARASLLANNIDAAEQSAASAKQALDFDSASFFLLELDIAIAKGNVVNQQQRIKDLLDKPDNKAAVLVRAISIYRRQQQWRALHDLLPAIKKYKVLGSIEQNQLLTELAVHLLPSVTTETQAKELRSLWKSFVNVHDKDEVLAAYCQALINIKDHQQAQKILEQRLPRHWNEQLIVIYGRLDVKDKMQQLNFAESFLSHHANNAVLLLTLGGLAKNNGYLAKSKDYLLRSLQRKPSARAYEWLADIAVIQQDLLQAQSLLRQALALAENPQS